MYSFGWVVWHVAQVYGDPSTYGNSGLTGAIQNAYQRAPHTFLIAGITLVLSLQLVSLGVIAAQSKRYFEELYHLGTSVLRRANRRSETTHPDDSARRAEPPPYPEGPVQ
jgi:hypothetical protein